MDAYINFFNEQLLLIYLLLFTIILGFEVIAVYHNYEGDHTQPFEYFIGCKVAADTPVPEGLSSLEVKGGKCTRFVAKGPIPMCIAQTWQEIWADEGIDRAYHYDFEVFGEQASDLSNAVVDIFVSVN